MKIFSTSLLCLFASAHGYQEIDPAVKASIASMDPFQMSLKEVFILGKLLRKGADSLTSARLSQAFAQVKPTETELQAFYNLQQLLLKKATNMDEGRLALLGLEKSTIAYPDFFTVDTGLSDYRHGEMVRATLERETEKQLMAGPLGHLKSGETELAESRPIRKSKGLEFFLDIRNMGFDQQWKIGEWFKLHPTARLTKRRLSNIFHNSRQPSIRELNAFHVTQQNALRGKIENAWTQKMMDTLWYNLTPDPL